MEEYIDHTALKAFLTRADIDKLITEAVTYGFKAICVNPFWVKYAKERLKNSDCLLCTVIGFPLGANTKEVKVFETIDAIKNGADEIDVVINIGKVKEHDFDFVYEEIFAIRKASENKTLKVIIETCYLTSEEIKKVCQIAKKASADFIKTSTGFGTDGALIENIILMKEIAGNKMYVKASGGIRTKDDFEKMLSAGADRIGTSNSVKILEEIKKVI